MPLSKVLWTALTGTLVVTTMLLGAWGHDTTIRLETTDQRLATVEQHYAAIEANLSALHEELVEMRSDLERQRENERYDPKH